MIEQPQAVKSIYDRRHLSTFVRVGAAGQIEICWDVSLDNIEPFIHQQTVVLLT